MAEAPSRPSAIEVSGRALCLAGVYLRGSLEYDIQITGSVADEHRDTNRRTAAWLQDEGLVSGSSAREAELLQRPLGGWGLQDVMNASWRAEAIGVLLWALGSCDRLPAYDVQFDFENLRAGMPILEHVAEFVDGARLRDASEIDRQREVAELWHWRSRTTQLIRTRPEVQPPSGLTVDEVIAAAAKAVHQGDMPAPIVGDFPAFGAAYAALSDDQYALVTSIASERHLGLNWLAGYSSDWDETPTDT